MKTVISLSTRVMLSSLVAVLLLLSSNTKASTTKPIIVHNVHPQGGFLIDRTDDTVKLWDLHSGRQLWALPADLKYKKVVVDPQGKYVLTTHERNLINLWKMKSGEHLITIDGKIDHKRLKWIKVDPTGKYIVAMYGGIYIYSTARESLTRIWQAKTGRLIKTIRALSDAQMDPSGRYLAGSKRSKGAKVVRTPFGFAEVTEEVREDSKFENIFDDSISKSITIWSLATGYLTKTLEGHPDEINKVIIDPTGRFVLGASYSGTLSIWNVRSGRKVKTLRISAERIYKNDLKRIQIDESGQYLSYYGMNAKTAQVWRLDNGEQVIFIEHSKNYISKIAIDGVQHFAISVAYGEIKTWDLSKKILLETIEESYFDILRIQWNSNYLVSSSNKEIIVWNIKTGDKINSLNGHSATVLFIYLWDDNPLIDGPAIVSRCEGGIVNVWDLVSGKLLKTSAFLPKKDSRIPYTIVQGNYIVGLDKDGWLHGWNVVSDTYWAPWGQGTERISSAPQTTGGEQAAEVLIAKLMEESNPAERLLLGQMIGKTATDSTVRLLIDKLADKNPLIRSSAALALGETGNELAVEPLALLLKDKSNEVRNTALNALEKIYREREVELLIVKLKNGDNRMKYMAARKLGNSGDDRAMGALFAAFTDKSHSVRYEAAESFGKIGGNKAFKLLAAAIKDEDSTVRSSAVRALGLIGDDRAFDLVVNGLKDQSFPVREQAVWALGRIGGDRAVALLLASLEDDDSFVHKAACEALSHIGDERAVEPLAAFLNAGSPSLRKCARQALEKISGDRAVELLVSQIRSADGRIPFETVKSLAKLGGDRAVELLVDTLEDNNIYAREAAIIGLGSIGDERALESLVPLVENENSNIRMRAWKSIGDIGGERAADLLLPVLKKEPREVRVYIAQVMAFHAGAMNYRPGLNDRIELENEDGLVTHEATRALRKIASIDLALELVLVEDEEPGSKLPTPKADAEAVMLLQYIGGDRGVTYLGARLKDKDKTVRNYAARSLARIGSDQAMTLLIEGLQAVEPETRRSAAWGLAETRDRRVVEPLTQALEDEDDRTRSLAARALKKISGLR